MLVDELYVDQNGSLFLSVTGPLATSWNEPVVDMFSKVPVANHDGECFLALAEMLGDGANAVEAAFFVAGRQIDIPDV